TTRAAPALRSSSVNSAWLVVPWPTVRSGGAMTSWYPTASAEVEAPRAVVVEAHSRDPEHDRRAGARTTRVPARASRGGLGVRVRGSVLDGCEVVEDRLGDVAEGVELLLGQQVDEVAAHGLHVVGSCSLDRRAAEVGQGDDG